MKTKRPADNSIRIKRTFSPREVDTFGFDALILDAFFKSEERANRWWSAQAAATRKAGGDVLQANAPEFQRGDVWPYSVRVIKRAPAEYQLIAAAVRRQVNAIIKETELIEGETGFPREVR